MPHIPDPIERAVQQELKRRTVKVRVFPNEQALLRLVSAVLVEIDETWACDNKPVLSWSKGPTSNGNAGMRDLNPIQFPYVRLLNRLGGLIAGAIIEGEQRRANRRSCLLIRGWRQVELPSQEAARVTALSEADRDAYLNAIVGAAEVQGDVTSRTSFTPPTDPSFPLDTPLSGAGTVFLGKKVDSAVPVALAPGEGAVVIAYRRTAKPFQDHGLVQFARYDAAGQDLVYQPKDWKKKGDKTTYLVTASSGDGKAPYEVQVVKLTAGDYVIATSGLGRIPLGGSNCFGAPTFHVGEGEVTYIGDFVPVANVKLADGKRFAGLGYASHIEDARQALAAQQASLSQALKPAAIRNAATYACSGTIMDRWNIPGGQAPAVDSVAQVAAAPTGS
jgi:hypothetical protein